MKKILTPTAQPVTRKRSSRSEAHARVLAFLLGHLELKTLALYDLKRMAQEIGISRWQLDRVLSDFRACGWIHRHQAAAP